MVAKKKSVRKKKKKQEDSFIYLLLLSILTVFSVVLSFYDIFRISLGIIVIPIIMYLINYIYKNYDHKETVNICLISISMMVVYLFLLYNLENRVIDILEVFKYIFIYFIFMFANIILNKKIKNTSYLKTSILPIIIYLVLFIIF